MIENENKKEAGYSLLEMFIVLSIFSTLILITMPMFQQSIYSNELHQFFEQLEKDLYESQLSAITDGVVVRFLFSNDTKSYTIRHGVTVVKEQRFPEGLFVANGSLDLNGLRFLPSGTVSRPGTILFYHKNDQYILVIQLGRGRFYFEKL